VSHVKHDKKRIETIETQSDKQSPLYSFLTNQCTVRREQHSDMEQRMPPIYCECGRAKLTRTVNIKKFQSFTS
jgi:hypothetical protein